MDDYEWWETPHGLLWARIGNSYTGLRGQGRTCLIEPMGRVHHYDSGEIERATTLQDLQKEN